MEQYSNIGILKRKKIYVLFNKFQKQVLSLQKQTKTAGLKQILAPANGRMEWPSVHIWLSLLHRQLSKHSMIKPSCQAHRLHN